MEFIRVAGGSQRGRDLIFYNKYKYVLRRKLSVGEKWACSARQNRKCEAYLMLVNGKVEPLGDHNHPQCRAAELIKTQVRPSVRTEEEVSPSPRMDNQNLTTFAVDPVLREDVFEKAWLVGRAPFSTSADHDGTPGRVLLCAGHPHGVLDSWPNEDGVDRYYRLDHIAGWVLSMTKGR